MNYLFENGRCHCSPCRWRVEVLPFYPGRQLPFGNALPHSWHIRARQLGHFLCDDMVGGSGVWPWWGEKGYGGKQLRFFRKRKLGPIAQEQVKSGSIANTPSSPHLRH